MQRVQQPTRPLLSCESVMSKSYMFAVFKMAVYTLALGSGKWVQLSKILRKHPLLDAVLKVKGTSVHILSIRGNVWKEIMAWEGTSLACLIFGLLKGTLKSYKRKAYQPGFQWPATLGSNWVLCLLIWRFDFHFMHHSCCLIGKGWVQLICVYLYLFDNPPVILSDPLWPDM